MNAATVFFRERSLSKLAAIFDTEAAARSAASLVMRERGMHTRQVLVVCPFDADWGRKVEPEGVGIRRTAVRAHLAWGAVGFAFGLLLFLVTYGAGWTAVTTTPGTSMVAMTLISTMLGLIVGGLFTVRPDHEAVVRPVQEAVTAGRWAVVVHPESRGQLEAAVRRLSLTGARVIRTW